MTKSIPEPFVVTVEDSLIVELIDSFPDDIVMNVYHERKLFGSDFGGNFHLLLLYVAVVGIFGY